MSTTAPAAWRGSVRYEFVMAARGRVLWLASIPLLLLAVLISLVSPAPGSVDARIASWALSINLVATLGPGVALADRFARLRAPGLGDLLKSTPASTSVRMTGVLAGSLAAALVPAAVLLLLVGTVIAVIEREPVAMAWSAVAFGAVVLPAVLVLVTFAAAAGTVMPVPFARVAAVLGWFWATIWNTDLIPAPTITGTVLSPLGDYVTAGWMHGSVLWAGRGTPGISPAPTAEAAWVNLAVLFVLSTIFFGIARAVTAWRR